jgi:hypothetical protein
MHSHSRYPRIQSGSILPHTGQYCQPIASHRLLLIGRGQVISQCNSLLQRICSARKEGQFWARAGQISPTDTYKKIAIYTTLLWFFRA